MEERNPLVILAGVAALIVLIAFCWMFSTGKIGLLSGQLETTSRSIQQVDSSWNSVKSEAEDLVVFLFYNEDRSDYTYAICNNNPGLSFGYFFALGGTSPAIGEGTLAVSLPSGDQENVALFSTNTSGAALIKAENNGEVTELVVDPQLPFAVVLPFASDLSNVTLYDAAGQPLPEEITQSQP